MAHDKHGHFTRRALLKAGVALPLVGIAAPNVLSQPMSKSPTKVLDFLTYADVAKAEQEGQLVFYCHENEAGTAGIMRGLQQGFPEDQDELCARADRRALQQDPFRALRPAASTSTCSSSRISRRRSISRRAAATSIYESPRIGAYKQDNLSAPKGDFFWTGVDPAGIAYNKAKVKAEDAPKSWKDILNPRWKQDQLQDLVFGNAIRAVVHAAQALWRRLLERVRQAAAARFRFARAAVRPARQGRRHDHRDRRISGLYAVQEPRRRGRVCRAGRRPGGDAAGRRRGEQGAASGSRQTVRRLGDVEPRPGLVPDQPESLLRLGARPTRRRCRPASASPTSSCSIRRTGTTTPSRARRSSRNGTGCSGCDRGRFTHGVSSPRRRSPGMGSPPSPRCSSSTRCFICCRRRSTSASRRRGRRPPTVSIISPALLDYPQIMLNTLIVSFAATVMALVLGFLMAWILTRTNVPGRLRLRADDGGALLSHAAARRARLEPARLAGKRLHQPGLARARRQRTR